MDSRYLALVTGASRRAGIGAAIAMHLARDGWDVATTFWRAYDLTMPHGSESADVGWLHEQLAACGAGALDRIVLAAAREFRDRGIVANVVNPGPTDTGWMTAHQMAEFSRHTPGGRVGLPEDCANLVRFLCSAAGGWINGQLLHSDGGL